MMAVIFASAGDREGAHLAAARLRAQGWRTAVAMDGSDGPARAGEVLTGFPRRGNLNGTQCMAGIYRTLLDLGGDPAEVVAKVDADMWLSEAGAAWLAAADGTAHGFALGRSCRWLGVWAARRDQVAAALRAVEAARPCGGCAESFLSGASFRRTGGVAQLPPEATQVWRAGRDIREGAALVTLPSRMDRKVRAEELQELFRMAGEGRK